MTEKFSLCWLIIYDTYMGASLAAQMVKNLPTMWETWVQPLGQEDPLEKGMATPVFLPGEFHGQRRLARCSLWGHVMSDATEQLTHTHNLRCVYIFQEGRPFPGPESGLLCNTWKRIVWGNTSADKARDFIGKGCLSGEQQRKGTQENCSGTRLTVSHFMVGFQVVPRQSFWLRVFTSGSCVPQSRWFPVIMTLGNW